ncbi:hypothetical protein PF003_g17972 [Phytophthora fragariae]|nr:hypothetical protein PF003_g17972 [Phytophthora fragariae]
MRICASPTQIWSVTIPNGKRELKIWIARIGSCDVIWITRVVPETDPLWAKRITSCDAIWIVHVDGWMTPRRVRRIAGFGVTLTKRISNSPDPPLRPIFRLHGWRSTYAVRR